MRGKFVGFGLILVFLAGVGLCAARAAGGACSSRTPSVHGGGKPAARACGCGAQHAAGKSCRGAKHAVTNGCARGACGAARTNATCTATP